MYAMVRLPFGDTCSHCGKPDPASAVRAATATRKAKLEALGQCNVNEVVPKQYKAELKAYAAMLRDKAAEQRVGPCGDYPAHIPVRHISGLYCARCEERLGA